MSRAGPRSGAIPAAWALLGTGLLLTVAVVRLTARGLRTIRSGLEPWEWVALVLLTGVFVVGEGILALQKRWVPKVIARTRRLVREESLLLHLLAPLYAMGLVSGSRAGLRKAWAGVGAIVLAVVFIRALPPPWRGITGMSVAGALAWGVAALGWQASGAFGPPPAGRPRNDPDDPGPRSL